MLSGRDVVVGTVYEIEHEARWRVWALFGLLVGMVLACVIVVAVVVDLFLRAIMSTGTQPPLSVGADLGPIALVLLISFLLAVLYWYLSRIGAHERLIRMMHARPLDPDDRFHQRLANIVEEMRIATGVPAVQCLTVPTVGMNAFTFSDLHGGACIGVTEGALSRLSREQLQGVVAQEFGHVLSGDYETATTACLLFGIYGDLADSLDDGLSTRDGRAGISLISGVLRLLQAASAVTNAALSRQREWVADAAAAHFTRDPLSLAQALQMMIRHPGGGGYIPDALSALCIRPTDLSPSTWVARAMATHPPVNDRIAALLNLAHVGWDQFQEQAAAAEAAFEQREHVTEAPGAAAAAPGADRLAQVLAAPGADRLAQVRRRAAGRRRLSRRHVPPRRRYPLRRPPRRRCASTTCRCRPSDARAAARPWSRSTTRARPCMSAARAPAASRRPRRSNAS